MTSSVLSVHDFLSSGRYQEAVLSAADVFDEQELIMRRRAGSLQGNAVFLLAVDILLFAVALKLIAPLFPQPVQNRALFAVYGIFFCSLFLLPVIEYFIPRAIVLSYLFRKELFIHRFMDRYRINLDKPVLVGAKVSVPLFFRWGKVTLSNSAIARLFSPVVWVLGSGDPMREILDHDKAA